MKKKIYKHTPKYIIATYFDTKLSMFGLLPSAMGEGAQGPQNSPKGHGGLKGPLSPPQELEGGAWSAPNF